MVEQKQTATAATADRWRKDRAKYNREIRFRTIIQASVARAMSEHGEVDPRRAERAAHDIATAAACLVLELIYEEDAELKFLRSQLDGLMEMAADAMMLSPKPLTWSGDT